MMVSERVLDLLPRWVVVDLDDDGLSPIIFHVHATSPSPNGVGGLSSRGLHHGLGRLFDRIVSARP